MALPPVRSTSRRIQGQSLLRPEDGKLLPAADSTWAERPSAGGSHLNPWRQPSQVGSSAGSASRGQITALLARRRGGQRVTAQPPNHDAIGLLR